MSQFPEPVFEKTLNNFYYAKQLRTFLIQFMALFDGLQVQIGKNDLGSESDLIKVPVRHGSVDRVVAAVLAENTQNKMIRLPIMSAKIVDISIDNAGMKGIGVVDRRTYIPPGGSMPDDLKVVRRLMPVPYKMAFELAVYTSNQDQQFQIFEQIGLVFDPIVQIQTSDKTFDWTKIREIELTNINLEETYPAGQEPRMLVKTYNFATQIFLSGPANYKSDYIKSVQLRLATIPTDADIYETVTDIGRADPPYEKLFDIDDYNMPPI